MLKSLVKILVGCAGLAASGCPKVMPERSAREWLADGRTHSAQSRWEDAVADFTEVLRLEPMSREALVLRAHANSENGDVDQALDDCDTALRLQPNDAELQRFRADILRKSGDVAKADQNLLETNQAEVLYQQGRQAQFLGDYRAAAAGYEAAVRLNPNRPNYLNQLAWVQATCPDDAVRNGRHAVEVGCELCKLTQWREPKFICTLAAAYAETGQFDEAVKMQQKAVNMVGPRWQQAFQRRLKMYQESKPYRLVNRRSRTPGDSPGVTQQLPREPGR